MSKKKPNPERARKISAAASRIKASLTATMTESLTEDQLFLMAPLDQALSGYPPGRESYLFGMITALLLHTVGQVNNQAEQIICLQAELKHLKGE